MGNCIKYVDPLGPSLSRGLSVDSSPIKASGLPIIFVIGGPGAGKRTLCTMVAKKYGFHDIISTDIIRSEISTRTERAFALARIMSQGKLIPSDILVELISVRMMDHLENTKGFIVSGFPRERSQCREFDKEVGPPDLVLLLNVRNSVLRDRILARRIMVSERIELSYDEIRARIKDFHKRNRPVTRYYKNVLVVIDAEPEESIVFEDACEAIDKCLVNFPMVSYLQNQEEEDSVSEE